MAENLSAKRRLNGSHGTLQINGEDWAEVTGVQIQIELGYADVQIGLDAGKKLTSRSGSGNFSVTRAYSRSAAIVEQIQQGKQPVIRLVAGVKDPDAVGGQEERVAIDELELTTIDVMTFTHGELMTSEYPFTFPPSALRYLDRINPQ